jgi:hypothetical protein
MPVGKYTPARMSIMNVNTAVSIEAQFNPTELDEDLGVDWNRLAVLGLSHKPMQYLQTDNEKFSFELAFRGSAKPSGNFPVAASGNPDVAYARRFLKSLCYSSRNSPATIVGGAPPRVLFVWPSSTVVGFISLTCVITHLHFHHTLFAKAGDPSHFGCKVDIEEIRDFRLYSEDVLSMGTARSGQSEPGQSTGGASDGTTYGGEF